MAGSFLGGSRSPGHAMRVSCLARLLVLGVAAFLGRPVWQTAFVSGLCPAVRSGHPRSSLALKAVTTDFDGMKKVNAANLQKLATKTSIQEKVEENRLAMLRGELPILKKWRQKLINNQPQRERTAYERNYAFHYIRPKVTKFKPKDFNNATDAHVNEANRPKEAEDRFIKMVRAGMPYTEVFLKFEGITDWKKIGDMSSEDGNWDESLQVMIPEISTNAYEMFRKIRLLMTTAPIITYGYANEKAEIVASNLTIVSEAADHSEYDRRLVRTGFYGVDKDLQWYPESVQWARTHQISRKMHHLKKPELTNSYLNAQSKLSWLGWVHLHKPRPRNFQFQGKKRGMVVGNAVTPHDIAGYDRHGRKTKPKWQRRMRVTYNPGKLKRPYNFGNPKDNYDFKWKHGR